MTNYIFVYGILKSNEWYNNFLAGCKFIGMGRARGYVLLNLGGCPGMIPGKANHANDATGEIYSVSDKQLPVILRQLDQLEHVGKMYLRAKIQVELVCDDNVWGIFECIAYLYIPVLSTNIIIPGGNWSQAERGAR